MFYMVFFPSCFYCAFYFCTQLTLYDPHTKGNNYPFVAISVGLAALPMGIAQRTCRNPLLRGGGLDTLCLSQLQPAVPGLEAGPERALGQQGQPESQAFAGAQGPR